MAHGSRKVTHFHLCRVDALMTFTESKATLLLLIVDQQSTYSVDMVLFLCGHLL